MKKGKLLMVALVALLMAGGLILSSCYVATTPTVGCPSGRPNTANYCSYYTNCGGNASNSYYCLEYYSSYYSCDCQ